MLAAAGAGVQSGVFACRHVAVISMCDLASGFNHAELGVTAAAYAGCKLSSLVPAKRGLVLETVARGFLQKLEPNSTLVGPVLGDKCDGRRRGAKQAEYDWLRDGRRVQCKSAQLHWLESQSKWHARFRGIKPASFDELLLILYSPGQLHFFRQDTQGSSSPASGRSGARGRDMAFSVPRGWDDPKTAKKHLVSMLKQSRACTFLGKLEASDELITSALHTHTDGLKFDLERDSFYDHPLAFYTPTYRALAIQQIVQEVDSLLHHGVACSKSTRYDWRRGELRVECKHSRIAWSRNRWTCKFWWVKRANFDLLYLAIDTPAGLRIFQFGGTKFLQSTGKSEASLGKAIQVSGPAAVKCWSESVGVMTDKLLVMAGSKHVANVVW